MALHLCEDRADRETDLKLCLLIILFAQFQKLLRNLMKNFSHRNIKISLDEKR